MSTGDGGVASTSELRALLRQTQIALSQSISGAETLRCENHSLRLQLSAPDAPAAAAQQAPNVVEPRLCLPTTNKPDTAASTFYVSALSPSGLGKAPVQLGDGVGQNANLVVSPDGVDLVVTRARLEATTLLGISPGAASSGQAAKSPGGLLLCCFAPSTSDESPPRSSSGGGASTSGAKSSRSGGGRSRDGGGAGRETLTLTWTEGQLNSRVVLEGRPNLRRVLEAHTQTWSSAEVLPTGAPMAPGGTRPALCLLPVGDRCLDLCLGGAVGASHLLSRDHTCALMGVVPPLESLRPWELSFSTRQHGVSLATLFRRSGRSGPTLLVVRDTGGHVFGCYSADGWRLSTRFYGNGQTCVFQLEPHRVAWPWDSSPGPTKNDFYMHGTPERLVVGASAGGQCAIYLDGDLLRGSSGACSTFGSPCLASNNEFTIQHVEVWQVAVG